MIDACADAKVDVVKFQAHLAEAESTLDEPLELTFPIKIKKDLIIGSEWNFHTKNGKSIQSCKRKIYFYGISFF